MAAIIQSSFPGYSTVNNTSGSTTTVKSAGRVTNVEQHDAALAAERSGRLNLSQFGIIKLPREVLILQSERDAKVKGTQLGDQVQSSSKSDMDEDRLLAKLEGTEEDNPLKIDPLKPRKEKTATEGESRKEVADKTAQKKTAVETAEKKLDVPQTAKKQLEAKDTAAFTEFLKTKPQSENARPDAARRSDDRRRSTADGEGRAAPSGASPRPSIVGAPTTVYATVQTAGEGDASGQNLSVVA